MAHFINTDAVTGKPIPKGVEKMVRPCDCKDPCDCKRRDDGYCLRDKKAIVTKCSASG